MTEFLRFWAEGTRLSGPNHLSSDAFHSSDTIPSECPPAYTALKYGVGAPRLSFQARRVLVKAL